MLARAACAQLGRGREGAGPPGFKDFLAGWRAVVSKELWKRSSSPHLLTPQQQPALAQQHSVSPELPRPAPVPRLTVEQKNDFITSLRRLRQVVIPCHALVLP